MERLSRRQFLEYSALAGAAATAPGALAPGQAVAAARCGPAGFRTSLSVSPFTEGVLKSVALTDGHVTGRSVEGVQRLFIRHGATEVYARIATRRNALSNGAEMGFARGLERARLARGLRLPFNPELGLWAVYGDAEGQPAPDFTDYPAIRLPGPWHTLTIEQMEAALHHYGELVARQIRGTGVTVNFWDLGNEVEFGIAGVATRPLGGGAYQAPDKVNPAIGQMSTASLIAMSESDRIAWLRANLWPYIGRLLAACADGIRSVDHSARFSTHISGIFENTAAVPLAFWEEMSARGYHPDLLGTSYYASAGAIGGSGNRLQWLEQTAAALQQRFRKRLFISETGYPSGRMSGPYPYNVPVAGYPLSTGGQDAFIREVVAWGASSGRLGGIRPWAPDLCTASSEWEPMSFFSSAGGLARAKPALAAISQGLSRC